MSGVFQVRHGETVSLVGYHEDAAVRAVFGAQTTSDAVVFDDDLKMFASVNGIDRTSDHAMWIRAGSAGGRDHEIVQTSSVPKQTWNWNAVRSGSVLFDATSGTCVAARTIIQIEHENALTLVETLRDIFVQNSVAYI